MSHADVYREKVLGKGKDMSNDMNAEVHLALVCSKSGKWSVWLKINNEYVCI